MKKRMLLMVIVIILGFALQARGELVTFEFEGKISEAVGGPPYLGSVGDPFWGYLTYDTSYGGSIYDSGTSRTEYYENWLRPENDIVLSFSTPFTTVKAGMNAGVTVTDSPTYDSLFAWGEYVWVYDIRFGFEDSTGTALSDTSLPTDLKLDDWSSAYMQVDVTDGYVRGDIKSIHRVPEAQTTMLLIIGIIGLAGLRRWRKIDLLE